MPPSQVIWSMLGLMLVQFVTVVAGMYTGYKLHAQQLLQQAEKQRQLETNQSEIYGTLNDHGNRIVRIETICKVRHQEQGQG